MRFVDWAGNVMKICVSRLLKIECFQQIIYKYFLPIDSVKLKLEIKHPI